MSEGFVDAFRAHVREARVSTRQIVLEVTEREELPDLDAAAATVANLRDLGFHVAIDDVGIGHSLWCRAGQGYLMAPPLPFGKFIARLDRPPERAVDAA